MATIAGAAIGAPLSNMVVSNAGVQLLSAWANVPGLTDPNTFPEIYKTYGPGNPLFRDILIARGKRMGLPSNPVNVIEELSDERPIFLESTVAQTTAGGTITIKLAASNYEGTKTPVQARDKFLIPAQYLLSSNNSEEYIVHSASDITTVTLTGDTIVLTPLNSTSNLVAGGIPAGTPLSLSGNSWARGEGQPKGKYNVPVQKYYYWNICKETVGLEQDVLATKHTPIAYQGNMWIINDLSMKAERRLDKDLDAAFHHGTYNSNSAVLVGESGITGDDGVLQSGDGLTTLLDAYGMCDYYDTTFEVSHLGVVTEGFMAQEVNTTDVQVFNGHGFWNNISDLIREYIGAYSGGMDMYDPVKNLLGISPTGLNYNGYNFYFQTISTLSSPSTLGLTVSGEKVYEYDTSAIFIPDNSITVSKFGNTKGMSIPGLFSGYVDYNGENNGKVTGILKGMTNLVSGNLGTDKAGVFYYWMAEELLGGGAWNQKFYFRQQ